MLDLFMIILSVASLVFKEHMKQFQALRALRMISRDPGMKQVVNALFLAIPAASTAMFLLLLFFLVFAIMAVNTFKGRMHMCQGDGFAALSAAKLAAVVHPVPFAQLP